MKIASFVSGTAALFSCALSLNAGAHALWLESGTPASKLYFGEYAENLRETSPGRLDSIVEPDATIIDQAGTAKRISPSRENTHFSLPAGATVLIRHAASRYEHHKGTRQPQFNGVFFTLVWVTAAVCRSI